MAVFRAYSARGAVLIWRQSAAEIPETGTAAPRPKWYLLSRGRTFVYAVTRDGAPTAPTVAALAPTTLNKPRFSLTF